MVQAFPSMPLQVHIGAHCNFPSPFVHADRLLVPHTRRYGTSPLRTLTLLQIKGKLDSISDTAEAAASTAQRQQSNNTRSLYFTRLCVCVCVLFAPFCEFPKLSGYNNHCLILFFLKLIFPSSLSLPMYICPLLPGQPGLAARKGKTGRATRRIFFFFYTKIT